MGCVTLQCSVYPMNTAAYDTQDASFSLTGALHHLMCASGCEVDVDDLHAALGLSLMFCASKDAPTDRWPTLARDAFIPKACKLFGMIVRDLHPPEAARGLGSAETFEQHFVASYLPHIERAIENGQSVLAWQGWPGEQSAWGILSQRSAEGIGLAGIAFSGMTVGKKATSDIVSLTCAPLQVYVVEINAPTLPPTTSLLRMTMRHTQQAWSPTVGERFGVLLGKHAAEHWLDGATVGRESWGVYRKVALSWLIGCASFLRFLDRHHGMLTNEYGPSIGTVTQSVTTLHDLLEQLVEPVQYEDPLQMKPMQSTFRQFMNMINELHLALRHVA